MVGDGWDVGTGTKRGESPIIADCMALRVELNDEHLLTDLMGSLASNGCVTKRVTRTMWRVGYPLALDGHEAWLEIQFFIHAWQARHPGADAVLTA